jgi:hypothetical protein
MSQSFSLFFRVLSPAGELSHPLPATHSLYGQLLSATLETSPLESPLDRPIFRLFTEWIPTETIRQAPDEAPRVIVKISWRISRPGGFGGNIRRRLRYVDRLFLRYLVTYIFIL